jgi:5-methylthioribose kinase
MPDYLDLTADNVTSYVREKSALFAPDAELSVRELGRNEVDGDGVVNYIFRIADTRGHSVILKQAKPFIKLVGEAAPVPVDRNRSETDIMSIRSAIVPQYVPKVLHLDRENNLYICEDCGRLGIMRFGLARGKHYPRFASQLGKFIAKNNFYTSELYLDQGALKELGVRFTSPEMSRIMETILFLRVPFANDAFYFDDKVHETIANTVWNRREMRLELLKLRDIYMKKQECLVHGDLHTSNTMASETEMKIIDMEYTHLGPFSSDTGYLLGNFIYAYAAWFFHTEGTEQERAKYREEILGYITGVMSEYQRIFFECFTKDAKDIFRPYPEYLEDIFAAYITEACGFMGSQVTSRAASPVETFDFDVLPELDARNGARALALATGYNLTTKRGTVSSPEDVAALIRESAAVFFGK